MELNLAVSSLGALAHEGRLSVFRLLVQAGPSGLPAGEVARRLDIRPNTLSASLNILNHAGLVTSRRDGRWIIYAANFGAMSDLLTFLMEDCCGGAPEVCAPLVAVASACCLAADPVS